MAKIYGGTTTTPLNPEAIKNVSLGSSKVEIKEGVLLLTQDTGALKVTVTKDNVLVIN